MSLQAQQVVGMAAQIARVTGMGIQAGQLLNAILLELCQTYDLSLNVNTVTLNIVPGGGSGGIPATGPYSLPLNYLRAASRDLTYTISGVPYRLTQITLAQLDALINTVGSANFPTDYATDISPLTLSPPANPLLYLFPPPITAISLQIRYYGSQPDIPSPETSTQVPWFPDQIYLIRRLAGELMAITGDPRANSFLGDGPSGAVGMLRRWLELQGDKEDTASSLILDPRVFGMGGGTFPPSKITGGI